MDEDLNINMAWTVIDAHDPWKTAFQNPKGTSETKCLSILKSAGRAVPALPSDFRKQCMQNLSIDDDPEAEPAKKTKVAKGKGCEDSSAAGGQWFGMHSGCERDTGKGSMRCRFERFGDNSSKSSFE